MNAITDATRLSPPMSPACLILAWIGLMCCSWQAWSAGSHDPDRSLYLAPRSDRALVIDGVGDEPVWQHAEWRDLKYRWLGPELEPGDFEGRYKVAWTEHQLTVLVEIVDDVLIDRFRDPLVQYWDDDTLEIFVDEDHSGGNHQYNHNAFAYHVALDNQAVDIGTDRKPRTYNDHIESRWRQSGEALVWEVSVSIYSDAYRDDANDNHPVRLHGGKIMGFLLAYCDNDGSDLREHFMGSEDAPGAHKDRGWIDAGLFGTLQLVD